MMENIKSQTFCCDIFKIDDNFVIEYLSVSVEGALFYMMLVLSMYFVV